MNWDWDLSYLYQSFEDPAFAADLAALPELNAQLAEAIKTELPAKEKLEKLVKLDTLHDLAEEAAFIRDVLIPGMGFVLFLCHNTGIIHDLPLPPLIVIDTVFLIIAAIVMGFLPQILSNYLCRPFSGKTGQFYFNPEFLLP